MSNASIYSGQTTLVPVVNAFGNVFEEWQIAAAAQTIFNIASFQYTPGTNTLLVFKNGLFQRVGFDYVETNSTRVTFLAGLSLNDRVAFFAWATAGAAIPNGGGLPAGGALGQVPVKLSGNDYDVGWTSVSAIAGLLDKPVQAIVSANTIDLTPYVLTTRNINISGSTAVAGFQLSNGQLWSVKVSGSFILTNSANLVCPGNLSISARPGDSFLLRAFADNQVEVLCFTRNIDTSLLVSGQCRFTFVSTVQAILNRWNGSLLPINGVNEVIPSAGVTLSSAGLSSVTLYYVYAWMNAGVMTLEASVTVPIVDTVTGVKIKTGDSTRTLVGMVRPQAAATFQDSAAVRGVISYFNRVEKWSEFPLGGNVSMSNTGSLAIITAGWRAEFIKWAEDPVLALFSGVATTSGTASVMTIALVPDASTGSADGQIAVSDSGTAGLWANVSHGAEFQALGDGYHYVEPWARCSAGTFVYQGLGTPGLRCMLRAKIMG